MNCLKAIQASSSFTLKPNHETPFRNRNRTRKRRHLLSLCKSDEVVEGDSQKQELLARIAMLQTQKLRLTDYLDETSAYLTQFAEEANAEIDQIGENALRDLDQAAARIMENMESRMQAFEETMEQNKLESGKDDKELADFEEQIDKDRNEGLFFMNLSLKEKEKEKEKPSVDKAKVREETDKIREVNKKSAGSVIRRNAYIGLIVLVAVGIGDATISATPNWGKIALLAFIQLGLLSQLVYEHTLLSQTHNQNE